MVGMAYIFFRTSKLFDRTASSFYETRGFSRDGQQILFTGIEDEKYYYGIENPRDGPGLRACDTAYQ